jgi:ribulose-phosphate 3-epimerase
VNSVAVAQLRALAPTLSVGVLTADLLRLGDEVRLLEKAGVGVVHFDVMDGCFCPSMTFGPPLIKAVRTTMLKDVHLMIEDPLPKLDAYVAAGADILTVSVEGCRHPHRVLQAIGELRNANDPARGLVRGVGLNPGTPLESIVPLLDEVDLVLLLAVNPGWGGQRFIAGTAERVRRVIELGRATGRDLLVCVDGGIKRDNVAAVAATGVHLIVTGSAVFDGKDAATNAAAMLEGVKRHG